MSQIMKHLIFLLTCSQFGFRVQLANSYIATEVIGPLATIQWTTGLIFTHAVWLDLLSL